MKSGTKKFIIGGCIIGFGILLIIIACCMGGFGMLRSFGDIMIDFDGVHYANGDETLHKWEDKIMLNGDIKKLKLDVEYGEVILKTGDVQDVEISTRNIIEKRFSCETSGDTLNIKYKGGFSFFTWKSDAHIYITLPEGTSFESSDIDNGAGRVEIDNLKSDVIDMNNGAGELEMNNIIASEKLIIETGAGAVKLDGIECGELNVNSGIGEVNVNNASCTGLQLDSGVGAFSYSGEINGDADIDNGVGELKMTIYGNSGDYNIKTDNGVGQVKINGNGPIQTTGGKYNFKVSTGIGEVKIDFINRNHPEN